MGRKRREIHVDRLSTEGKSEGGIVMPRASKVEVSPYGSPSRREPSRMHAVACSGDTKAAPPAVAKRWMHPNHCSGADESLGHGIEAWRLMGRKRRETHVNRLGTKGEGEGGVRQAASKQGG